MRVHILPLPRGIAIALVIFMILLFLAVTHFLLVHINSPAGGLLASIGWNG